MGRLTFALAWLVMSGTTVLAETRPLEVERVVPNALSVGRSPNSASGTTRSTFPAERGRALYLDGDHADGRPFAATTGGDGLPLPPAFLACVNCHGFDARGKTEGGVVTSDLRWDTLAGPYEFARADGRRRAPYDEAHFFAAIAQGRDSSGHTLDPAMPRFDLSAAEAADLVAYLKQIGRATDEGVAADAIRVGLALPDHSLAAASAAADRRLVAAWFDALNRKGGIFRRRIELVAVDPSGDSAVLPLLVVLDADAARSSTKAAWARQRLPFLSVTAEAGQAPGRYAFALFPNRAERARALGRYAIAHDAGAMPRVAVVYPVKPIPSADVNQALAAVQSDARMISVALTAGSSAEAVRSLRTREVGSVVLLGGSDDFRELLETAGRADWDPLWLWTEMPEGVATGRRAVGVQPAQAADASAEARAGYAQCIEPDRVAEADRARQWALLGAAQVLVAALENAGRELGREKLIAALESLQGFSSGFTRPGGFSPRSHTLASGVYVVPLPTSQFQRAPEWVTLGD